MSINANIKDRINNYRRGLINLDRLIFDIETCGRASGLEMWEFKIYPVVFDLELINSEIIDKGRKPTESEIAEIENLLNILYFEL